MKTKIRKQSVRKFVSVRGSLMAMRGFTIVELLISIAIFSLVTSFGVTVFVRSLRAQRSVVALISANDNASLAIEAIAGELRRGRNFSANDSELSFINAAQKEVVYRFEAGDSEAGIPGAITRSECSTGFYPVTAPNIVVEEAHFLVSGIEALPKITMSIKLGAQDRDINGVTTVIHTTVSSRGLNNQTESSCQ
ncbi:MAG: type II secretion system protein [bacterium]|nr:type II secretion system protein [bacterium]